MNMGIVAGLIKALAPGVDPEVIEQAVTDWLDEHPEATTTVQDGSITEAKLAQDVLAELGEIEELKEAIEKIEEELNPEEFVDMTPYSTIGSAMINENGCREGRSVSRVRRYKVLAGQKIKLYITKDYKYSATYQFQNDETIPYSNNTYIVGTTHTDAVDGVVIVPEGATWLMVSCDNDSETLVVQLAISKVTIMDRNTDVLDAVYASSRYGVHGGGEENPNKMLSIVVSTDVHGWYERLNAAVEYMNAIPSIDGGCCLGDIVSGNFTEDITGYNSAVAEADKPWFTVIGNHDCGNSTDPSLCGTTAQVVTKFITPNEEAAGQEGLTVPYYYYDWTDYNIRFIVLYNYDSPTDQSGGAYIIRRGGSCYGQTQLEWLVTTLNSTPSGYGVVILRHGQPETNVADSGNFTQIGQAYTADNGTGCYSGDPIVSDIVNAWVNGTTLSKSYTPESEYSELLDTITISADFTSRGEGEFICYLVGHMHKDIMCHDAVHTDQKVISLAATAEGLYQNANCDLPRITGRKSIDCITVVSFDTIGKRINLVRIGSNKTITMVDRTMISIPYGS